MLRITWYTSHYIPLLFCSLSFSFNFSLHFPFHFRNIVFFIYFHFFLILLWSKKGLKTQLFRCIKHCFHRWKMKSFSSLNLWYSKILITHTSYDAMDRINIISTKMWICLYCSRQSVDYKQLVHYDHDLVPGARCSGGCRPQAGRIRKMHYCSACWCSPIHYLLLQFWIH